MNSQSTEQASHQILQQSSQMRPRVAFIYQQNQPHQIIQPQHPHAQFTYINQNKNILLQPNFQTPKKISDKQNNNQSSKKKYQIPYINQMQIPIMQNKNFSISSPTNIQNLTNCPQLEKKNSSPNLMKFPPVSPKIPNKKIHNRCPSFLSQKSKIQENSIHGHIRNNFTNINNCKCGKLATHMVLLTDQKCCSKCGITKMIKGQQLQPYVSPVSILIQKQESKIKVKQSLPDLGSFLKSIDEQKLNIQRFYKQNLQKEDHNIIIFYKERKLELKSHYQKIKAAIKQSIQQDLRQIELLQQQQICQWRISVAALEQDINKLQKIQTQLKKDQTQNKQANVKAQQIQQYKQIAYKNRSQLFGRTSKHELIAEADTMNISGISNATSHNMSALNKTIILNNFNVNGQVYKPQFYRMVNSTKTSSARPSQLANTIFPSSIFSAGNQSPILSPRVMQYQQNQNKQASKKQILEKPLLFSFQGKKK